MKLSKKLFVILCIGLVIIDSIHADEEQQIVKKRKKKLKKSKKVKNVQGDAPKEPQAQEPSYPDYPDNYDYGTDYEDNQNGNGDQNQNGEWICSIMNEIVVENRLCENKKFIKQGS